MTALPFDPAAVSSLAEVLAEHTGGTKFVPPADLSQWLPDLAVPRGWDVGVVEGPTVTRMLLRRPGSGDYGDGCEVLNLHRVPGAVPESLILDNSDRTLRDIGADAIQTHRVDTPPRYGVIATRSSGRLLIGARTVHCQYSYYAVNTVVGGALIEQAVIIGGDERTMLSGDMAKLTENLYRALLTSIDRVPTPPSLQNTGQHLAARCPESVSLPTTQIQPEPSEIGREWRPMSVIRVNFLTHFYYGDDAVLLTLDGGGVDEFKAALSGANPRQSSRLEHGGVTHEFRIESDAADIELEPTHVLWRLDSAKAAEIIADLAVLSDNGSVGSPTSGHFYVDMSTPTQTLVVSRDEYVDVVYPWQSPA
jgi:hypothetical protein